MEKKRLSASEVKRYLALKRIGDEVRDELKTLEKGFLDIVPGDGFRYIGPYQVCHKTSQKKTTKWKEEFIREAGEEAADIISAEAPLGAMSHSIKVNVRRDMIPELRMHGDVPEHIPDEQVGDYIIMKKVKS